MTRTGDIKAYAGAFAVPVAVMAAVFAFDGVAPFGENTIFNSDLAYIYSNYLADYRDMVLGGAGVFWSWSIGMGYNMYSYFTDNTSSPLNLIVLLFPDDMLSEAVLVIQLLRVGLAGLAMCWYLQRHDAKGANALVLACAYALCAYVVCFFQHVMWMDNIALLPIAVYAAERMMQSGRMLYLPLLAALVAVFWCSYYLGWMTALFLALYTMWYTVVELRGRARQVFKNLCRLALGGVFTFLLLGFAIVPSIFANLGSGGFTDLSLRGYFNIVEASYSLFFATFSWYREMGRPLLYCGLFTLLLVGLFFANREISRKERAWTAGLLAVLFASLLIAPLYFAWHMFDQPDWFEGRFTFCIIFFLIAIAARELAHARGTTRRQVLVCATALLAVFAIDTFVLNAEAVVEPYTVQIGPLTVANSIHRLAWPLVALNVVAIAAYAVCAMPALSQKTSLRRAWTVFLRCACILELAASAVILNQYAIHLEPYVTQESFSGMRSAVTAVLNDLGISEDDPIRVEKMFSFATNDALAQDYNGIAMFGSGYDPQLHEGLSSLGFEAMQKKALYNGSTPVTDALLGVRYVLTDYANLQERNTLDLDAAYQRLLYPESAASNDEVEAHENEYALPLAYLASEDAAAIDVETAADPLSLQNDIVKVAFGTDADCFVPIEETSISTHNVELVENDDGSISLARTAGAGEYDAWADFTVSVDDDAIVFAYCDGLAGSESGIRALNASEFALTSESYDFKATLYSRIIQLENEDGSYTLRLAVGSDGGTVQMPVFYRLDEATYRAAFSQASAQEDPITQFSSTRVEISVDADAGEMLMTSLPAADGWTATVNGEAAETTTILGGFIGVELPEGEATVVLSYRPPGWDMGLALTGFGLVLLAAWLAAAHMHGKRNAG